MNENIEKVLNKLNEVNYNNELKNKSIMVYTYTNDIIIGNIYEYGINKDCLRPETGYLKLSRSNGLDCTIDMSVIKDIKIYSQKEINIMNNKEQ
jgi:hypothetical protein